MLHSKQPPVARKFSEGGAFALCFERNCDITPALSIVGQSVLTVGCHLSVYVRRWRINRKCVGGTAKQKSRNKKFKKISKRNLLNVGMGGWMEALAEKHTNKERTFHNIATFHTTIPT